MSTIVKDYVVSELFSDWRLWQFVTARMSCVKFEKLLLCAS